MLSFRWLKITRPWAPNNSTHYSNGILYKPLPSTLNAFAFSSAFVVVIILSKHKKNLDKKHSHVGWGRFGRGGLWTTGFIQRLNNLIVIKADCWDEVYVPCFKGSQSPSWGGSEGLKSPSWEGSKSSQLPLWGSSESLQMPSWEIGTALNVRKRCKLLECNPYSTIGRTKDGQEVSVLGLNLSCTCLKLIC